MNNRDPIIQLPAPSNVREVKIVRKVCLTDALNRRLSSHQTLNAVNY